MAPKVNHSRHLLLVELTRPMVGWRSSRSGKMSLMVLTTVPQKFAPEHGGIYLEYVNVFFRATISEQSVITSINAILECIHRIPRSLYY